MARVFAIVLGTILWLVGTVVFLFIGPIFWVPILVRTLVAYAAMMLLHAIANRELVASTSVLEKSITWFPEAFRTLWSFLMRGFRVGAESDSDEVEDGEPDSGDWLAELWSFARFFAFNLIPAAIVWIPVYLLFLYFSIDLLKPFRDGIDALDLLVWVVGWTMLGAVGVVLLPVVRSAIVLPFVFLIALLWLVVGLVFWIPEMAFAIVRYTFSLLRSAISGKIRGNPVKQLEDGFNYYFKGFEVIWNVLSNRDTNAAHPDAGFLEDLKQIAKPLRRRFLYLLFWPVIVMLIVVVGGPATLRLPSLPEPTLDQPPASQSEALTPESSAEPSRAPATVESPVAAPTPPRTQDQQPRNPKAERPESAEQRASPPPPEKPQVTDGNPTAEGASTGNDGTMPTGTVDEGIGDPIFAPEPIYPRRALEAGKEGIVRLEITILPSGAVGEAIVVFADPPGYFEEAAVEAVKRRRYSPQPRTRYHIQVEIEFRLR